MRFEVDRVVIEPFDLRQGPSYDLVVDRLTHWYATSREWIKKAVLMDDLYVFNNPWAIQSMEKHTSYCAMIRLGMPIPDTWIVPAEGVRAQAGPRHHARALRQAVRPRRGRRPRRLPDVRQAVRRRRLGRRQSGRRRRGPAPGLRRERHVPVAPATSRRSARPVRPLHRLRPADPLRPLRPVGTAARPLHDGRRRHPGRPAPDADRHHDDDQLVLRLGVQLLRGAAPGRRPGTRSTSPTPAPTRR